VRIRNDIRCFGMHPSGHPLEVLRDEAGKAGCVTISEASEREAAVRIAAIVAASHRVPTGQGRIVQFITLEDETGLLEATIPPGAYASLGDPVDHPGPFLVDGTLVSESGLPTLRVTAVRPFHERASAWQGEPVSP
jgi:DNA polymerase III alpha subunit